MIRQHQDQTEEDEVNTGQEISFKVTMTLEDAKRALEALQNVEDDDYTYAIEEELSNAIIDFESFRWPDNLPRYDPKTRSGDRACKFVRAVSKVIEEEGFGELIHYQGRYFYDGPAVLVDDADDMKRIYAELDDELISDNMGLGYVVYLANARRCEVTEDAEA